MSSVIPNRINDALIEGSENIFDAILARAMQKELLIQQESEFARSHALDTREVDLDERADALATLVNIAPFLPKGMAVGEMKDIHPLVRLAFPGSDPAMGELSGMVFNEQTLQDVLRPAAIEAYTSMDEPQKQRVLDRAINVAAFGEPVSGEQLEISEKVATTTLGGIDKLIQDPKAREAIVRQGAGLEVPTRFTYQGREYVFDTATGATLTAELLKHLDLLSFRKSALSNEQRLDIAGELIEQMGSHEISLGRPAANRIIQAWERTRQLASAGKLSEQNNPLVRLYRDPNITEEERAAIDVFTGALSYADFSLNKFLSETPEGQQAMRVIALGQAAKDFMPVEDVPEFLDNVTHQLEQFADYNQPRVLGIGNTVKIIQGDREQRGAAPGPKGITEPGGQAGPTVDDLRTQMMSDAEALARGELSTAELNLRYPDAAARRAVAQTAQQIKNQRGTNGNSNR